MGSEIRNLGLIGSLLNWACFIYASPIDLETCSNIAIEVLATQVQY